jgi:hypothetical protein
LPVSAGIFRGETKDQSRGEVGNLRVLIRKAAARSHGALWQAVGQVCNIFSGEECFNFFAAAGFETD